MIPSLSFPYPSSLGRDGLEGWVFIVFLPRLSVDFGVRAGPSTFSETSPVRGTSAACWSLWCVIQTQKLLPWPERYQ